MGLAAVLRLPAGDVRVLRLLAGKRRTGGEQGGLSWRRRVMDLRSMWLCCVLGLAARVLLCYVRG